MALFGNDMNQETQYQVKCKSEDSCSAENAASAEELPKKEGSVHDIG